MSSPSPRCGPPAKRSLGPQPSGRCRGGFGRVRTWVMMALALASLPLAAAQISVPTFGTRGGVPEGVLSSFMPALRTAVGQATGLTVSKGDLITPGIAGSLEPEFAMLIAELDNARYAVSGEIAASSASSGEPYTVNLIVVDAERKRSTDLISRPLQPGAVDDTARALAAAIARFTSAAVSLPTGSAGLFVSSEPGDAEVVLNGVSVGRTSNLDVLMLKPGRYELEVRKEGFLPEDRTVDLRADDTSFVHVIMTAISGGSIQLSATPGARVYLDGVREGVTPVTLPALPGSHTVRLERDGFRPESFGVLVRNYRVTRVAVTLKALSDPLVFWSESRPDVITIDGIVQNGGYAVGLMPGLHSIELRGPNGVKKVLRAVPEHGVYQLDLNSGELIPLTP